METTRLERQLDGKFNAETFASSKREQFHYLLNLEDYPQALPVALKLAESYFDLCHYTEKFSGAGSITKYFRA